MEYVQRGERILATSRVGEGRSVDVVVDVVGRVTQMLLHAAADISTLSGEELGELVRRRRMVGKPMRLRGELFYPKTGLKI